MKIKTKKVLFTIIVLLVAVYFLVVRAQMLFYIQNTTIPNIAVTFDLYIQSIGNQYRNLAQEIQRDKFIDTWLRSPSLTQEEILKYLDVLSNRYGLEHASLIEEKTLTYYGTDKILSLSLNEKERDGWYFTYRDRANPRKNNNFFYIDKLGNGPLTIFINIPHFDEQGFFLGLSGGGFVHETFEKHLNQLEQLNKVDFYLVQRGKLVYADPYQESVHNQDLITRILQDDIQQELERNKHLWYGYPLDRKVLGGLYRATYLPEWDCYAITGKTNKMVRLEIVQAMLPHICIFLPILVILGVILFKRKSSSTKEFLLGEFIFVQNTIDHVLNTQIYSICAAEGSNARVLEILSYKEELFASLSQILTANTLSLEFFNPIISMKQSLLLTLPSKLKMPIDIDMRLCSNTAFRVHTNKTAFETLVAVLAITTYFHNDCNKIIIHGHAENRHPTITLIATKSSDTHSTSDGYDKVFSYLFAKINITYNKIALRQDGKQSRAIQLRF